MQWHARDPWGVRHVENRHQAKQASILKTELEKVFGDVRVKTQRLGDDELQRRIRIDDVIMTKGAHGAHVHVYAEGDELERRQAFVWLHRNKGSVKTALAERWKTRARMPKIYFVESQYEKWATMFAHATKYPEKNLPNPHLRIEKQMMARFGTKKRDHEIVGRRRPELALPEDRLQGSSLLAVLALMAGLCPRKHAVACCDEAERRAVSVPGIGKVI